MIKTYLIESPDREHAILEALTAAFPARTEPVRKTRAEYLDTFEWALHRADLLLEGRSDAGLPSTVLRRVDGALLHRIPGLAPPAFAADLPDSPLAKAVRREAGVRRLVPKLVAEVHCRPVSILDSREKTVARVLVERGRVVDPESGKGKGTATTLLVEPLRGYEKEAKKIVRWLDKQKLPAIEPTSFARGLALLGLRPGDVDTKFGVRMDDAWTMGRALREILQELFRLIRLQEPGLVENVDSEFLHDYRVAVRRTRSALGQVKNVLPAERSRHFRKEFKWLGGVTGPTRDLDVYLLKLPGYLHLLPPEMREDLAPLTRILEKRQASAHAELIRRLDSKRYRRLERDWERFLEDDWKRAGRNEALPVRLVANKRIHKLGRRILAHGEAIDDTTPAEALHALRIECKKFRYLLEFFRSLYPADDIAAFIRELKRVQDNLGDFNDYEVQQADLATLAESVTGELDAPEKTLLAMGRLVENLRHAQQDCRHRFTERFAGFASGENRKRLDELFRPEESG